MIIDLHKTSDLRQIHPEARNFELAFTSGCYDLLHPGHIYFLKEMHSRVQEISNGQDVRLMVVIHDDEHTALHKGPSRPIFPDLTRVEMLDAIKYVDIVGVWHGWETIVDLVYALKPDYLVANKESIRQANWENSWQKVAGDIKSHLIGIPVEAEISTTKLIAKIKSF